MVDDSRKRRALALSAFFRASIKLNLHLFDVLYNKLYNKSMTKSTTSPQQIHSKSTADRKPATNPQHLDITSCRRCRSSEVWLSTCCGFVVVLQPITDQYYVILRALGDNAVAGVQSCVSAAAAAAHYVISNLVLSSSRTLGLSMMLLYTPH